MAKLYPSVTGGFSGRLGQVVGYQWNGRWCLRTRPAVVRNPRTARQQAARAVFSGGVQQAAKMRWAVMEGLRDVAREAMMTPYNVFSSLNSHAFSMVDGTFTVDYPALRLSAGPVAPVAVTEAMVDDRNVLNVKFDKNPMRMRTDSHDNVRLYAYCPALGYGYLAAAVYRRQGRVALALDDAFAGQEVHIYMYVTDEHGRASETAYGGSLTVVAGAVSEERQPRQLTTIETTDCGTSLDEMMSLGEAALSLHPSGPPPIFSAPLGASVVSRGREPTV